MTANPSPGIQAPTALIGDGILSGVLVAVATTAATYYLGWHASPPAGIPWEQAPAWRMLGGWTTDWLGLGWPRIGMADGQWHRWAEVLAAAQAQGAGWLTHWQWLARISAGIGLAAGGWVGWLAARPAPQILHERGRQRAEGRAAIQAARKESAEDIQRAGAGIRIHPQVQISLDRETRHLFVLGSVGGGKTQIITPLIQQAISRGDKCIIYDNKADFSQKIENALIIAPWDYRSPSWDIARDCQTRGDARALAARLVPESKDPMWSSGARQILTGILVSLQRERGLDWGWKDIADKIPVPLPQLRQIMEKHHPEGIRAVEEASKTTQSLLITLSSYMAQVFDLADAFSGKPEGHSFSIVEWLMDPEPAHKTIILQGNARFAELQKSYIQGLLAMFASRVNSPELPDNKERRIWLFLDEFPQLGKMPEIQPLLEIGRSKGVRLVIGAQDIAQLRDIYGRDAVSAWTSMVGTYVVARIGGAETARWISEMVGQREIRRYSVSRTATAVPGAGSSTGQYQADREDVISPDELATLLGPHRGGVKAMLHTGGQRAYIMDWPYTSIPDTIPPHVAAPWTQPGWPRLADQAAARLAEIASQTQAQDGGEQPADPPRAMAPAIPDALPAQQETETTTQAMEVIPLDGVGQRLARAGENEAQDEASDPLQDAAMTSVIEHIAGSGAAHVAEMASHAIDLLDMANGAQTGATLAGATPTPVLIQPDGKRRGLRIRVAEPAPEATPDHESERD